MKDVNEYIDNLKSDMQEYSTLFFDSDEEFLIANEKERRKAIKNAIRKGDSKYTDRYLQQELEFTEQVIKELQSRMKGGNKKVERNILNEANGSIFNDKDREIFDNLKNQEEEETALDLIQDRIGQDITVGELNTVLQSIFGKYDDVFLLANDLYSADVDEYQELIVWDDDDMYTITFLIQDMEEGIIQITDAIVE